MGTHEMHKLRAFLDAGPAVRTQILHAAARGESNMLRFAFEIGVKNSQLGANYFYWRGMKKVSRPFQVDSSRLFRPHHHEIKAFKTLINVLRSARCRYVTPQVAVTLELLLMHALGIHR
jgi:hypothetical protein